MSEIRVQARAPYDPIKRSHDVRGAAYSSASQVFSPQSMADVDDHDLSDSDLSQDQGGSSAPPKPKRRRLHGACDACRKKKGERSYYFSVRLLINRPVKCSWTSRFISQHT